MTQFNLGYRIEAKDATRSTLASALSNVTRFGRLASKPITIPLKIGRAGLGLLRDVNLGLRPLVAGIDSIIDRGSRLEVVSKSFQSLTDSSASRARRLAKELVLASSGTLKLSKAMETANRALGSGLNFSQIRTAIEFISKKSITTGKNAEQAIEKVITGLSRGSTLFLDDFGILVDGIDGVRRALDKVEGAGAFDSLGPAGQKAEIIRQAIAEMSVQMGKIGVTGKETIFVFQGIKNAIGDSFDKLVGAVAGSKALKEALQGIRDTLGGITKFLEGGGSIFDVLLGKDGGKSGGLLGIAKAVALDVGEAMGRGILAGMLKGIVEAKDLLVRISPIAGFIDKFNGVKDGAVDTAGSFFSQLSSLFTFRGGGVAGKVGSLSGSKAPIDIASIVKQVRPSVLTTAGQNVTSLDPGGLLLEGAKAVGANLASVVAKEVKLAVGTAALARGATLASKGAEAGIARNAAEYSKFSNTARGRFALGGMKAPAPDPRVVMAGKALGFVGKRLVPAAIVADFFLKLFQFTKEFKGLLGAIADAEREIENEAFAHERLRQSQERKAGRGRSGNELRDFLKERPAGLFELLNNKADSLLSGGVFGDGKSRTRREFDRFRADFPKPSKPFSFGFSALAPIDIDRNNLKLTERGRRDRELEKNLLNRDALRINAQARRDARRFAGEEVRRLRRGGFEADEGDRKRIEQEEFIRLFTDRTVRQRKRFDDITGDFAGDRTRRQQEREKPLVPKVNALIKKHEEFIERSEKMFGDLIGAINDGIKAITGVEREIISAGGRRS